MGLTLLETFGRVKTLFRNIFMCIDSMLKDSSIY